jgi:FtsP/CotA-like multicopper oxidase with cupredoxin domain
MLNLKARRRCSSLLFSAAALCAGLLPTAAAQAQVGSKFENPPALVPKERGAQADLEGVESAEESRTKTFDLSIVYRAGEIYNPGTAEFDKVNLRSYEGTGVNPTGPYISPLIEATPGDTVRVKLNNNLPSDMTCHSDGAHVNKPHCFNSTNLHTHGLWVNPSGNGDNVLLSINPGVAFEYEYNIPDGHPAGTFWYHTHRHGSTALQVSSGMAGALIIRGDRAPGDKPGDLDRLLKGTQERILVLQQIQYACRNSKDNTIKTDPKRGGVYLCEKGDVGAIESYDLFGPGQWQASGRYTSINGLILPTFDAQQGALERWRMIHAGVRDTISLQFKKYEGRPLKPGTKYTPAQMDALVDGGCDDTALDYHLAAADGITMYNALATDTAVLQPGYRFDALVAFPDAGTYCVIDKDAPGPGSVVGGTGAGTRLLGLVNVAAGSPPPAGGLPDILAGLAERNMPESVRAAIVADVRQLNLTRFAPHKPVADGEVTGTQEMTFLIDVSTPNTTFNVGSQDYAPRPYVPDRVDRQLTLGGVDEWTLRSEFVSHPFHIHVNPFQIISIKDPSGKEVSLAGSTDDYADPKNPDPQYRGLMGVWKDTLMVKSLISSYPPPITGTNPQVPALYTIKVRTRYERYIGEFVLHCHILDHEDQGMMQNVAIVLPGTGPAAVNAGSGGHGGH